MNASVILARHFSYLVWLLMHEPGSIEEQKGALRALVASAREEGVHLGLQGATLEASGHGVPAALTGVPDVTSQLALHGLALISISAGASPAELLGVARIVGESARKPRS